MKNLSACFFLLSVILLFSNQYRLSATASHAGTGSVHAEKKMNTAGADTCKKENTPKEKAAIKSAYDSIRCKCDCSNPGQGKFNEEGAFILFKNGLISKKGCFSHYKLICGIDCVYDDSGKLILIKKVEDGKVTGEIPFPN